MKSEKLMKLLGICSCCVLLGGCAGVNARVQETETVVEETGQSEKETDVEENVTEAVTEVLAETEQVLDESQEVKTTEDRNRESADKTVNEETEKEPESESEEEKALHLEYQIEDQELEIGKCFGDIKMPEYAEAEDGSKVTGKVEWRRPGGDHAFDSDMALTGADGDKKTWEWVFVPDEEKYEKVSGTVEITMKNALSDKENDEMATLNELWKKKEAEENAANSSSSGSSIGASNVLEITDFKDVADWMGSLMTGTGILGNRKNHSKEAGKENFNVAHGTVAHETERTQINEAPETETDATEAEGKEKMADSVSELQKSGTDKMGSELEHESESGTEAAKEEEHTGFTREDVKRYNNYGMTVFAMVHSVSQIIHGNTLK